MVKNARSRKRPSPGEIERLTALIEQKAEEIAHVLLWDVSDAEKMAEGSRRQPISRKNGPKGRAIATAKPKRKRELNRLQRVNAARRTSSWRG